MISNTLPQSLIDNPLLSQWIAFEQKGRVRVGSGKVEIGQGILTALTQIAAEELDAAAGADQSRLRPDRRQPGRGLHLRQLFDRGRRRIDSPGLRRGALAVPRSRRRDAALPARASFRSRTANSCAPERTPATTTGRWRARSRSTAAPPAPRRPSGRRPTRSSASTCRGSTCRPRSRARASSTTSHPRTCCTPACCASPGAARISPRSTRAPCARPPGPRSSILREGEFVAFTADSEIAVMRASEAARTLAQWEGGTPPPADVGTPAWLKAQPSRDKTTDTGKPGRAASGRVGRGLLLASVPHLWLDRPRPARSPSSRTARSRCGRIRRARRCCATGSPARSACPPRRSPCSTARAPAPTATTPPTTPPSMPPSSPCAIRAAPCGCNGRARTSSPPRRSAPPWRSRFAPCSMPTTSPPTGRSRSGARRTPSGPA